MIEKIQNALLEIQKLNPGTNKVTTTAERSHKLKKVLVANRGEIAKRFFLVLREEGISSVAIVTDVDRSQSWYEFADNVIYIGDKANYVNIPVVIAAIIHSGANAVYPGYGFLSENYYFVDALKDAAKEFKHEIIFMGPDSSIMKKVGNKLDARTLAKENGVPLFLGSDSITGGYEEAKKEANRITYPVIIKLNAGGGGKGMIVVNSDNELPDSIETAQRIGKNNYADDTFYLEKYIQKPVHFEVQIFNGYAIGIRKCAVQRRNQKVIEENGDVFLDNNVILQILSAAENMALISGYKEGGGAGTVEFLYDAAQNTFGFLEINTRLQVEYAVTDLSLSIDLAKWQILYFDGRENEIPYARVFMQRFVEKDHAIQCRIYAEDAYNNYAPAPGKIIDFDLPTFNGIRCDFGFRKGDTILPDYDPMIGKLVARGASRKEALLRIERALGELYVKGITSNIDQLLRIVRHPEFRSGHYTNRILDENDVLTKPETDSKYVEEAALFGSISEYVEIYRRVMNDVFHEADLQNILGNEHLTNIPTGYLVEAYGKSFMVELLQVSLTSFHTYINGEYKGTVDIHFKIEGGDNILISYKGRSYPIRTDKRPSFIMLRMIETDGRINYYRIKVTPLGGGEKVDPPGMMRSPFQGSFVKLGKDLHNANGKDEIITVGSVVEKGDPIIIISAMKMETTIVAPCGGKITYLVEDGDMTKLVVGTTAAGLVQGKPLNEGEILFIIEEAENKNSVKADDKKESKKVSSSDNLLDHISEDDYLTVFRKNPKQNISVLIQLIQANIMGFYLNESVYRKVNSLIANITAEEWKSWDLAIHEKEIESILTTYTTIKMLFSPAMSTSLSYFGEMNQIINRWEDEGYRPPYFMQATLNILFRKYDVEDWSISKHNQIQKMTFFSILRAHTSVNEYMFLVKKMVEIISNLEKFSSATVTSLNKMIQVEQSEKDDSLEVLARHVLAEKREGGEKNREGIIGKFSRKYFSEYRQYVADPASSIPGVKTEDLLKEINASIKNPLADLIPRGIPDWVVKDLKNKLEILSKKYSITRLHSYKDTVIMYYTVLKEDQNKTEYLCYSWIKEGTINLERSSTGEIISSENLEAAGLDAIRLIAVYVKVAPATTNRLEILSLEKPTEANLFSRSPKEFGYNVILKIAYSLLRFYLNVDFRMVTIDILTINNKVTKKMYVSLFMKNGKLQLDLLKPVGVRYPYWNGENPEDQKLYAKAKWPIEVWAGEAFDEGNFNEIIIPGIDDVEWVNPKTKKKELKSIGAKIFEGLLSNKPALFFMKDSRISGGATGDYEGQKYAAAAYIAYLRNMPLYVWNDGAGANIKEGMVSLNRAAEGFMMNSLLAAAVPFEKFYQYTRNIPDSKLNDLFLQLDKQFNLKNEKKLGRPENVFLVAVGVGSSTGLDVYGSSQASVQIMLDADQSYRVLTGSNVIKSVTGEDLTNYEIGGARVMGSWTGTVDLIADDKIHLLWYIKYVQDIFFVQRGTGEIIRNERSVCYLNEEFPDTDLNPDVDVINEKTIQNHLDRGEFLPFKDRSYGSGSLIAGFGKLAGHRVLVMAPRTNYGFRSLPCVLRGRELLQIANKTSMAKILIYGERWYRSMVSEDDVDVRARMDFFKVINEKIGIRIHIVTHPQGFKRVDINNSADAIIFVKNKAYSEKEIKFAGKVATFMAEDMNEAFNIAARILQLMENNMPPAKADISAGGIPSLPEETSKPFDMEKSVIEPVFDKNSFLEFFKEMNDLVSGPSLITGLATLEGKTVGVIADQPVKGGAPDAPGTEKFRVFMELLRKNKIPLVMLSNAPGFVPGTKQERLRIQQIGGESLDVNILSEIPVVSIVLNQNYGGRQIHAFSKFLRPGIAYYALNHSIMAVMGSSAAFDLFEGSKYNALLADKKIDEAKEMMIKFIADYNKKSRADEDAMKSGVLDDTMGNVKELRKYIVKGMKVAEESCFKTFA